MDSDKNLLYFTFFNEIGILSQLSRALLDKRLPEGMTTAHFSVVNHLIRVRDGQTPQALASAFQVPKTTMTHTLSGLAEQQLVEMRPNPEDGRSKRVWLTEKGRIFRDSAIEGLETDIEALSDRIRAETMTELIPKLAEIRQILDEYRDPPNRF